MAQELQTFIDTANAPIFGIDHNGLVNEWNNKSVEITGYSKDEVMGKSLVDVYISEDFRASVKSVLDDALKGKALRTSSSRSSRSTSAASRCC